MFVSELLGRFGGSDARCHWYDLLLADISTLASFPAAGYLSMSPTITAKLLSTAGRSSTFVPGSSADSA